MGFVLYIHLAVTTTPLPRSSESDANPPTQQPDALGRFGKFGGKYVLRR
jgi:tryptophan synthase beta chain